jgi:hypothetical protein
VIRIYAFLLLIAGIIFTGAIALFLIRLASIIHSSVRHPIETMKQIPTNWRKMVLCTDVAYPPEILPEIEMEDYGDELNKFRMRSFVREMIIDKPVNLMFGIFVTIPVLLSWYLPAIAYRWALKSTAWIWSPLLWAVKSVDEDLLPRLKEIRDARWHKWMRWYSAVVAFLFIAKFYLLWKWQDLVAKLTEMRQIAEQWTTFPRTDVLNAYIVPSEIPLWQIAAFTNAMLAWASFVFADLLLIRYASHQQIPSEEPLDGLFRAIGVTRTLIMFYTVSCTVYITLQIGMEGQWNLPPLGGKVFPWQ